MADVLSCNGCGARFRAPAAAAGRRLKCPKCGTRLGGPEEPAEAALLSLAESETIPRRDAHVDRAEPQSVAAPLPMPKRVARPLWRGSDCWTAADRGWFSVGLMCMVMGAAAHLLPHFGLQFRKLAHLGNAAPTAGTGLVVLGAFLVAYVTLLKGHLWKLLLGGTALLVLGFGGMVAIGMMSARSGPTGFPTGSAIPSRQDALPPSVRSSGPPPAGRSFGQSVVPVAPTHASLSERFGAERVARVKFNSVTGIDLAKTIRKRVDQLGEAGKAGNWIVSTHNDEGELVLAPIEVLDTLGARLNVGPVLSMDRKERTVRIQLNPGQCEKK